MLCYEAQRDAQSSYGMFYILIVAIKNEWKKKKNK